MALKKLIAGNWKMNGTTQSAMSLAQDIGDALAGSPALGDRCDFLVCPPAVHIPAVRQAVTKQGAPLAVGGQDCAAFEKGAYTGDIAAPMLKDAGCDYVILGHSERRTIHGETSALVQAKAKLAHDWGLVTIICVGEQESERDAGEAFNVVAGQLAGSLPAGADASNTVIAYEPVWAIGTGKSATPQDVEAMHRFIWEKLQEKLEDFGKMRILYGGSVKPDNAAALLTIENVDGALIGGASLKAGDFIGIAKAV